jgi:hypothetical protein
VIWEVAPDQAACPTVAELEAAYAPLVTVPLPGTTEESVADVRVTTAGTSIDLQMTLPAVPLTEHRSIARGTSSCVEMADTVAIAVQTWVAHATALGSPPAPEPPPTVQAPATTTDSARPSVEARVTREGPKSHLGLDVALGLDALVSSSLSASPALSVSAELRLSRSVGIGLLGSFTPAMAIDDAPYGSIDVRRQVVAASVALAIPGVDRLGLRGFSADGLAALALWHASAQSYWYPVTATQQLFEPGLIAGVRLRQLILGPLFLEANASTLMLPLSLNLHITRPDGSTATVATLPWFNLAFGVSVGARIF